MASEKFLKRLVGRTEVEDTLERLDTLTKEETLMAVTKNLEVSHHIDGNVTAVKGTVHNIDGNVEAIKEAICDVSGSIEVTKGLSHDVGVGVNAIKDVISNVDGNVKNTKEITESIDGNVKGTKELVENIDDNVKATKALTEDIGDNVKMIQGVDHNVKATKNGTQHFLSAFKHVPTLLIFFPKTVTEQIERSFDSDDRLFSRLRHIHREPDSREAPNMALGSRFLHQS
jgi:methyl-accepting chemotaxis protein